MDDPIDINQPGDSEPVAGLIFDSVGPHLKEFLSEYLVVGYRADTGSRVIVSDCQDHSRREELAEVIRAVEDWGDTRIYEE